MEEDSIQFVLPTTIAPRYEPKESNIANYYNNMVFNNNVKNNPLENAGWRGQVPYSIEIKGEVQMVGDDLSFISSFPPTCRYSCSSL